jgi:hypothetical protein
MTHPNRYVAAIVDRDGVPRLVAKVATDDQGAQRLANEVLAVQEIAPLLRAPLATPRIVAHEFGLLVFEFVPWLPRRDPTALPEDVAFALGEFYGVSGANSCMGATHGDFAPWNILRSGKRWTLLDWEAATLRGRPFEDICHYFVQSHSLLGRPSQDAIVDGFRRGSGSVGVAVRAYAAGAKLDIDLATRSLQSYLVTSTQSLLPEGRSHGAMIRERLSRCLEK